ncbi:MAG: PP2C family protein-serine/threonine phosphatase [Acidobacteriota bacterium]
MTAEANKTTNRWLKWVLSLGALLALLVVANSTYQYLRFTEFQDRLRSRGRNTPSSTPIETNLVVNASAAFALLGSLLVIGARSRYHLRAKRWEQQLALGRAVQNRLMPSADSKLKHVKIAAEFVPALEVGGDLYDVFSAGEHRVAFALGDVSGKGLPAALVMGMIQGAVRSNAWYRDAASHEEFAERLNELLYGRTAEAKFASLFWGVYDSKQSQLRYVSAGHCPGLVLRRGEVVRLDSSGPVLGLLERSTYQQVAVNFEPGDVLVLYSDGIVEGANAMGEEFGEDRLCAAMQRCRWGSAETVRGAILHDFRAFLGHATPDDDVTLLVLEAAPAAQPRLIAAA